MCCRRYSSIGLEFSYEQIPTAGALSAMLERSPITHAPQVWSTSQDQINLESVFHVTLLVYETSGFVCDGR